MRRLIIEMGMGCDLHGGDYTKAACRAVEDALRHASLPALGLPGMDAPQIRVTIGVQRPEAVDAAAVAAVLPHAQAEVLCQPGGLDVTDPDSAEVHVTASAAIEVFLPPQTGWRLRGG